MSYEWNPNKAKENQKKHGVKFADAVAVFEDENAITMKTSMKAKTALSPLAEIFSGEFWLWFTLFAV